MGARGAMAAVAVAAVSLAACATPTVYGPVTGASGSGWIDQRLQDNRWRVSFRGGSGASLALVDDYALLRAAELTLANGYDWFRIVQGYAEGGPPRRGSGLSVGVGGADFGRRSSVGGGVGASFDLSGGPQVTRTFEIITGRGPAPQEADVYPAAEVQRSIRARLGPPAGGYAPPPRA